MDSISLKALVDKESRKVILIECDEEFIDVFFGFLTVPIGRIIRLARKHSLYAGIGCIKNLYTSAENIEQKDFLSNDSRDMLLHPYNEAESDCKNLELKIDGSRSYRYLLCSNCNNLRLSYHQGHRFCKVCQGSVRETYPLSAESSGFVTCSSWLIVEDDLQVIPLSAASVPVYKKLGVENWNNTEELTFNIGATEVQNMLLCSLVSKVPLSESLLKHKPEPNDFDHTASTECQKGDMVITEGEKISVKLIVSKFRKMVCYAEAGGDFVNLLLSFLTLPLGFIAKLKKSSSKGCISQLYKAVQNVDEKSMMSNYKREMLLNPKVAPGFCYRRDLLGIGETKYYCCEMSKWLTTDRSRCSSFPRESVKVNAGGFIRGSAVFTVTNNLVVRSRSSMFELSVLKNLNLPLTDIEDHIVHVGKNEALRLLVASFDGESALTDAFITEIEQNKNPKQEH